MRIQLPFKSWLIVGIKMPPEYCPIGIIQVLQRLVTHNVSVQDRDCRGGFLRSPREVADRDSNEKQEDDLIDDPGVRFHPVTRFRQECLRPVTKCEQDQ